MLNALALRHTEGIKHTDQVLGAEETHQIVLEGDVEAGRTRVALTSGTAAQLVVNAARLMALGADHTETAESSDLGLQFLRLFARKLVHLRECVGVVVLALRIVLLLLFLRQCLD